MRGVTRTTRRVRVGAASFAMTGMHAGASFTACPARVATYAHD